MYERKRFLDGGFQHHELYFPDGTCPSQDILLRFLSLAESTPGALAIHCKAGLGRTGVLICSYIMKHYRFTAEEVIGYIRICRPGSVIGPQQGFIKDIQNIMWKEGDAYRVVRGPNPPPLMWGVTPAAATLAAIASQNGAGKSSGGGANTITLVVDATGRSADGARPAAVALSPMTPNLSDLSLKQLQDRISSSTSASSSSNDRPAGLVRTPNSSNGGSNSGGRVPGRGVTPQRLFAGTSTAGPLTGGLLGSRPASQQITMRTMPMSGNSGMYRSASANRERPTTSNSSNNLLHVSSSITNLRATLPTDTVTAANRMKAQPDSPMSQSSDFASTSWRTPLTSNSNSSRPASTMARVLAPNGQPRKVPAAAFKGQALQTPVTPLQGSGRFPAYYN